jgi:chromosomal replication initiator protein
MQESLAENVFSDLSEFWERNLLSLKPQLDPQIYAAYIKPLKLASYNPETSEFVITAPSRFHCNHIERNLSDKITGSLSETFKVSSANVRFEVGDDESDPSSKRSPAPFVVVKKLNAPQPVRSESPAESQIHDDKYLGTPAINPRYTFDNFVVGSSNQFCEAAARRVAEQPGRSYNPLFIYGGVGLGKTHLLHAIGNAVLTKNPRARVLYMSSETFTNELILALRHAKMDQFKNRLRSIELLLIDDIQFMRGKERTQEEFFHTFNALYNAKHQIVITSDKLPSEIPGMEERLQTRFSWGLTADIQAPDFETRVAILKRKASLDSFSIPEEVAHLIAEKVSSNVRELEGALTRLHAVSSLQDMPVSLQMAESSLKPLLQPKTINMSIDDIKKAVANHFGLKVSEIISKRRTKNLSFPRHIAMYLCRKHTTSSYPEIGAHFGGRDHSSVIHAANVVSTKVSSDSEVRYLVDEIEKRLLGNG